MISKSFVILLSAGVILIGSCSKPTESVSFADPVLDPDKSPVYQIRSVYEDLDGVEWVDSGTAFFTEIHGIPAFVSAGHVFRPADAYYLNYKGKSYQIPLENIWINTNFLREANKARSNSPPFLPKTSYPPDDLAFFQVPKSMRELDFYTKSKIDLELAVNWHAEDFQLEVTDITALGFPVKHNGNFTAVKIPVQKINTFENYIVATGFNTSAGFSGGPLMGKYQGKWVAFAVVSGRKNGHDSFAPLSWANFDVSEFERYSCLRIP